MQGRVLRQHGGFSLTSTRPVTRTRTRVAEWATDVQHFVSCEGGCRCFWGSRPSSLLSAALGGGTWGAWPSRCRSLGRQSRSSSSVCLLVLPSTPQSSFPANKALSLSLSLSAALSSFQMDCGRMRESDAWELSSNQRCCFDSGAATPLCAPRRYLAQCQDSESVLRGEIRRNCASSPCCGRQRGVLSPRDSRGERRLEGGHCWRTVAGRRKSARG